MSNGKYASPSRECDLIMQGGITSGVVYPKAALTLAEQYRFRCIGGTSAGAIAAAVTAAAELGRTNQGFEQLEAVPATLAKDLESLFVPARPFKGVFAIFLACLGEQPILFKIAHAVLLTIRYFVVATLVGLIPVAIYVWRNWGEGLGWLEWIGLLSAGVVGVLLAWSACLLWLVFVSLPKKNFGICSGMAPAGTLKPVLTAWISDLVDKLSGAKVLTFGNLNKAGIELKMMTTNLSSRRPYSLPFVTGKNPMQENRYAFNEDDWASLFPRGVLTHLQTHGAPVPDNPGYRFLPDSDQLPVIVAVRMSLSFPFLLQAVPLYRRDPLYINATEQKQLRRCVFSDGGISSNFPIHFFDRFLPTRPTFGITLEEFSKLRRPSDAPADRVYMPQAAQTGYLLPIDCIDSTLGFVSGILDSARLWQDNLQKILAGYRERTVHIALMDSEGGLNLNMPQPVIDKLVGLGSLAGACMLNFDLQEHQWRRFLVAYARLEESLEFMNKAYSNGFKHFLDTYPPDTKSYRPDPTWLAEACNRLDAVLTLAEPWQNNPLRTTGHIPKPDTDLRITPKP